MNARLPLLLLDVDGVLNPYGAPACPPGYTEHDFYPDDEEPVWLCATHGPWLRDLATRFEIVWAAGRSAPTLLITVDPVGGLTRAIIDRAGQWADDLI